MKLLAELFWAETNRLGCFVCGVPVSQPLLKGDPLWVAQEGPPIPGVVRGRLPRNSEEPKCRAPGREEGADNGPSSDVTGEEPPCGVPRADFGVVSPKPPSASKVPTGPPWSS